MNVYDLILSMVSIGFNVSTTIQLIKVLRTKSTESFAWFSLWYNTIAFLVEAVIFTLMGLYLTCIPFYYACGIWAVILIVKWKHRVPKEELRETIGVNLIKIEEE